MQRQMSCRLERHGVAAMAMALVLALLAACSNTDSQTTASGPSGASTTGVSPAPNGSSPTSTAPGEPPSRPAVPSAGCAATPAEAVKTDAGVDVTMQSGGHERVYRQFVPAGVAAGTPVPLVLDLHGLTQTRQMQVVASGWERLAATEHFVVITPQGEGPVPSWASTIAEGNPDTEFLRSIIDAAGNDLCIDTTRVYSGGISNGGLESSIVGCALADRVAAVGLVSGIVVPDECKSKKPMPMIVFWGKLDCVLPYYGGMGPCLFRGGDGAPKTAPSSKADPAGPPTVEENVAAWAARNSCSPEPTVTAVSEHVEKRTFHDCAEGADVDFYVISNGGHTWPGNAVMAGIEKDHNSPQGITTTEIDATTLMWEFYERFQVTP